VERVLLAHVAGARKKRGKLGMAYLTQGGEKIAG
jgi:hypothetical protein